jgi:GTP-binding protein
MLYDSARIHVQAGAGGDGCVSFRREAHVPKGGPDGGDGGRGGDVAIVCDPSLRDLQGLRRRSRYAAGAGGRGEGALRHGADGATLELRVPPGTVVSGVDGALVGRTWDLLEPGQRALVASGGAGGRGNKRFANATRQAPRFGEKGLSGEDGWAALQLKLLADVGLVGLPNAGKSSLLARLTRAAPKVASYPFTTLEPVLGVLDDGERQLVIADIPGLIEGAHVGAGLGHDFLAHIERTSLLVHVLDVAPHLGGESGANAWENYQTIERELRAHDERLARLERVVALSKADLLEQSAVEGGVAEWQERLGHEIPVIATSSATGAGLGELASILLARVHTRARAVSPSRTTTPPGRVDEDALAALPEHALFRPAEHEGFVVERVDVHAFAVSGKGVERLMERFDVDNEEAMAYVESRLRRMGVLTALEAGGFVAGDEIRIGGVAFELDLDEPSILG